MLSRSESSVVILPFNSIRFPNLVSDHVLPSKKSDFKNIALLLFLYMLQGVPIGITAAIPMLLQNRGVSFKQQAEFSLAGWPFCMKLLWAPIVDAIYSERFGRRKSWLIPIQYLIGIFMIVLSNHVMDWSGGEIDDDNNYSSADLNITALTILFFILNFLAATQDIAVDGWSLTILSKNSIGYTSTCNTIGQMFGNFLGFVVLIALESTTICNVFRIVPEKRGIITLSDYLLFWGIIFIVATTIIAICKLEHPPKLEYEHISENGIVNRSMELGLLKTYKLLIQVFYIKPVRIMCLILLTNSIMFAACDAVTSLKLIEAGISKDSAALLSTIMMPLQMVLPIFIRKQTTSARPFDVYMKAYPMRIIFSVFLALMVWNAKRMQANESEFPPYLYGLLFLIFSGYEMFHTAMFVTQMGFNARISDPLLGGTYMTMLNTMSNVGSHWPSSAALWFVDFLSWSSCEYETLHESNNGTFTSTCRDIIDMHMCTENGGTCVKYIDGYYVEFAFGIVIGIVWYRWAKPKLDFLQQLPLSAWQVVQKTS